MATVGLCIIAKDEAKVIRHCLESARPIVDYVLVVLDPETTDDTREIVLDFLRHRNLRGGVIYEPWRGASEKRNFALSKMREVPDIDYALMIDADDALQFDDGFDPEAFKASLACDIYDVQVRHASVVYNRPQMVRNSLPFRFRGVAHEFLEFPPGDLTRGVMQGVGMVIETRIWPGKYLGHAKVIEDALITETDPFMIQRYTFYLAQSFRDHGDEEGALSLYLKRAALGGWVEERYLSFFEAGLLMEKLGRPAEEILAMHDAATALIPARAEALHAAARYLRSKGRYREGARYARHAAMIPQPAEGLFLFPWVYDYGALDELAVNSYWTGAYRESLDTCLRLLASDKVPVEYIRRIAANARFAADKALEESMRQAA